MNQTSKTIIAFVVITMMVGSGIYYWKNLKTSSQPAVNGSESSSDESEEKTETTNWKTYSSMGVSISYPSDTYTVDAQGIDPNGEGFSLTQKDPSHDIYVYKIASDKNLLSMDNFSVKTINGKTYREFFEGGLGMGYGYVTEINGEFYVFESDADPNNSYNFDEVFESMMATVKWEDTTTDLTLKGETTPEQTLISFFDSLAKQDYQSAVKLFYPTDATGNYDWSLVTQYRDLNKQNPSKAEELAYYCKAVETCLKVEILNGAQINSDLYSFEVQFKKADNTVFLYGPFDGNTAEESPPETKFHYKVQKIDGMYKVTTPPLYRP
ncbi:hypothetical protein IPJ72_02470 [Candidatus Peregrinibacteria bacterium]|nr:MAG: hypothetical protein IPJ72_02470 [Candidatus Peregrinibacteria bacterium]